MSEIINSEVVREQYFKGDIIITDPCYICKKPNENTRPKREDYVTHNSLEEYSDYKHFQSKIHEKELWDYNKAVCEWKRDYDDWDKSNYGSCLNKLGINTFITHSTLYGDWGCNVYDATTKQSIGEFCADAGLVTACYLDEVLKYNPNFENEYIINRPWCVAVIKNFDGVVKFIKNHIRGEYSENYENYWKKGDIWEDDELIVIGEGNINFTTRQTSL